jgi:hypothetical protein
MTAKVRLALLLTCQPVVNELGLLRVACAKMAHFPAWSN